MIYIWNDLSTYYGGNPRKAYHNGDPVPPHIFSNNLFNTYLRNGKIIKEKKPVENIIGKPIKLSVSVMAHPKRQDYFQRLKDELGEDVPFSIDENNSILENCKAAWRLHDPSADFHVVIQDDAILCKNFLERAKRFIQETESKRIQNNWSIFGYNFFRRAEYKEAQMREYEKIGYQLEARNRGGVSICLPVNQINSMLKFFDNTNSRHDDERISRWIESKKFKMCYPIPSLVDHDDHISSLAGNPIKVNNRQAWKFIDNQKSIIPKIIHQFWVGPKPPPLKWMKIWKEKNPGWLYRLWTEKDILSNTWVNQKHITHYYKNKIWHGVADVCRYEILYHHGGFMPGADSICKLPIDDLFTTEYDSYGCYENEKVRPGLISPLMACVKGSKFALELIDGLHELKSVGEPWRTTGNLFMQKMHKKTKANVKIYPSHVMNPVHYTGETYKGNGKIYALQMWGSTIDGYSEGVESEEKKLIKLSISVMAHPLRSEFFTYLKDKLGEDVPFSIDQENCLLENSKASWRLYDPEADFHVVVQDDCIICDNFKERAIKFITEQEEKRIAEHRIPQGYNFFLKNAADGSKLNIKEDFYVDNVTRAGLAICLPVRYIEPMLIEFDKQKSKHDDDRISGFMKKNKYKIVFPYPSLVDHRIELESLVNNFVGLNAIAFIDDEKAETHAG